MGCAKAGMVIVRMVSEMSDRVGGKWDCISV